MVRTVLSLVIFLLTVGLVAVFGSLFPPGDWYANLNKPFWNPPSWVFGPVWSVLFVLMALAAWQVWLREHHAGRLALRWWGIQLVLNGAWSWLFFGLHRPGWAMAEMVMLFVAILITINHFRRIKPIAAKMMVPYLLWVAFAWVLNVTIWLLNGGGLGSIYG